MAGTQRKCANCRYFHDAGMPGNGWCTHPKRQHNSEVKMLVRAGELACRNSWGGDLFLDRNAPAPDPLVDADLPGMAQDDEVTSVVVPGERRPARPAEDRVVSDRPAARFDDRNDAAHAEQAERARIIARGSRDAIMQARQRASSRRAGTGRADGEHPGAEERVQAHQERFTDRDFAMHITDHPGATGPVPREEIRDRFRPQADERFESVPEIDPEFELPSATRRQRQHAAPVEHRVAPPEEEPPVHAEADPPAGPAAKNAVASRARRVRAAKQRQAARPLRHSDLRLPASPAEPLPAHEGLALHAGDVSAPDEVVARIDTRADIVTAPSEDAVLDPAQWRPDDAEVDIPAGQRESRGWLSRPGHRRGPATMAHDDAMVTRHASSLPWLDELDDPADDLPSRQPATSTPSPQQWVDPAPVPRHERSAPPVEPEPRRDRRPARSHAAAAPSAGTHASHDWLGGRPEPDGQVITRVTYSAGPAPDPVPVERPVSRPALDGDAQHRRRIATELPDLDDALFEDGVARTAAAPDLRPTAEQRRGEPVPMTRKEASPAADVARSSYFRASRFRDWSTPEDAGDADPAVSPRRLPDMAEPGFDARDAAERGSQALDMTIDIAPEIPRACRTCRSFRAADGGARGWCTNEWAFTHRRMVNEDDLACDSTIGCWWLPADRYLIGEDEDGYASPTPRMDALIARRDDTPARRTSGA